MREAVRDMWERMKPLKEKGYQPISYVEIVDTLNKNIIQSYQLTDSDFQQHLKSDAREEGPQTRTRNEHHPPTPHEYPYMARIRLEG